MFSVILEGVGRYAFVMTKAIFKSAAVGIFLFLALWLILAIVTNLDDLKHIYQLHASGHRILLIEENSLAQKYISREDRPADLVKERMSQLGWTFLQQNGAGYFFAKDQMSAIVTIKKWNHNYYLITVPLHVESISD